MDLDAATVSRTWLFCALVGAWFTWNALRPIYRPSVLAVVSFFSGWLTSEMALHAAAGQLLLSLFFIHLGGFASPTGKVALGITLVSCGFLIVVFRRSQLTGKRYQEALAPLLGPDDGAEEERAATWRARVMPFPVRLDGVERIHNVPFFSDGKLELRLNVHRRAGSPAPVPGGSTLPGTARAPVLVYVHGGGWVIGRKDEQGLPLLQHLAARGWVCFGIEYRLSPRATFPDHLIDVKRALAWVRAHAADYGGDPDFVVIAGGSAGGHLSSLAALTPNRREYQPGFDEADTRVQACIPFYGIYDFTDRHRHWRHSGFQRLLERTVMKKSLAADPQAYRDASPIDQVSPEAPPFLVVHGELDTMVPVDEARRFVAALRAVSREPVVLVEIPGAQHAFEIFPSIRTTLHLRGVTRFADWLWSRHRERQAGRAAS